MSHAQLKVMSAIETCRTAALGGHVERCEDCAHERVAYNSCRNRHCPKCQGAAARQWLEEREAELLPVPYYHVVFTLPAAIGAIAFQNKAAVYDLLFRIAAETLITIAADPKHLGARIGLTAVLHTWGSALTHHPHVHVIVPGGGLSPDGSRWIACKPGFFLPVRVLSRRFRRLFLEGLAALHKANRLVFFGDLAPRADKRAFDAALAPLRRSEWVVYAKRPFAGPQAVLAYLSRYTHRVAISNSRLTALDKAGVTFKWKDYRIKGRDRLRTMTLDAAEFIRRFLLHVLPSGFHRIRHMWTASWQVGFDALIALVGCGHMSGLLVRYRTAGPDDIRQSWSLSLRRARGSWRMSGCPGLSLRPCRSSRRCACQSLRN